MSLKLVTSLASAAMVTLIAQADTTTVETTTNWYNEVVSEYSAGSLPAGTSGAWSGQTSYATVTNDGVSSSVELDTDVSDRLVFTPTASRPSADRYRVTAKVKAVLNTDVPSNEVFGATLPLGSITPVTNSVTTSWYVWHRTAANAGAWVEMTGATPVEGTWYDLTMEFKTNAVRYLVDGTALTNASNEWLSNAGTDTLDPLGKVAFSGSGMFQNFGVDGFSTFTFTVDTADLAAAGITQPAGKTVAEVLETTGDNGLKNWQNLILGLNASDANAKPCTAPVQTADGKLGFTVGNIDLSKYASDATVTFQVIDAETGSVVSGDPTSANGVAEVTADSSAVKRYKVKITITK